MYNEQNNDEVIEKAVSVLGNNKSDLTTKEVVEIIDGKFKKLLDLSNALKKAKESAQEAKKIAEEAKEKAEEASGKSIGWFGKGTKDAIDSLQDAVGSLQNATGSISNALQESSKVQEISFDFQTQLAEISKYLFGLGIKNIANTREVVRNLEMKLRNASQEEIDELARKELGMVIKQLKDQEDIMSKQQKMNKIVKEQDDIVKEYGRILKNNEIEILNIKNKNVEFLSGLNDGKEQMKAHSNEIEGIKDLIENLKEEFEGKLIEKEKTIQNQNYEINKLTELLNNTNTELNSKANKKIFGLISGISIISMVISIVLLTK